MQKGFTLAETLITMAVIGIIMALSIPMAIRSTKDNHVLFKKAYKTVDNIVNELINDTSLYPNGEFINNTFCNNFFSKLNTIGYNPNNCSNTFVDAFPNPGFPPFVPATPATPVATTSDGMQWYDIQNDFTAGQCDSFSTGIDDTINTCIKIYVDINGAGKGENTEGGASYKDIFTIYITKSGRVTVSTSTFNDYNEAYILQH
jgi:prepilin-type N-terminal cleavage/methylation domain-containing protein